MTKIEDILNMMDEELDKAVTVPFSGKKALVDVEQLREYIDSIRYNMPAENKNAMNITSSHSEIISKANETAEEIIKQAEERAKILVSEEEIVKQAKSAADDLTAQAKAMDAAIKKAMVEKLDSVLGESEKSLTKTLDEVRAMRNAVSHAGASKSEN